jgi:ribosome-interacting GTPase 1
MEQMYEITSALKESADVNKPYRWDKLNLVRVYTKPKGKLPDYTQPVVLRSNKCTVEDFVSCLLAFRVVLCFRH